MTVSVLPLPHRIKLLKILRLLISVCLLTLLYLGSTWALVPVPKLTGHVLDLTGTLNSEQQSTLEARLGTLEAQKGSQLAVLLLPTTEPEDIAQFGIRIAESWKLGRKKVDDGVILIVAKNDRKLRIEVGYGLEGAIPDAIAKRVIAETITPLFKQGDFAAGVTAGVEQLARLIEGEALPAPITQNGGSTQPDDNWFIVILFGGIIIGSLLTSLFGRLPGGILAAVGSGVIASMLLGVGIAIFIGLLVFFIVGINQGGHGGWTSGGYGDTYGGGSSWGSGDSGGFSGGGGDFGGGGASGSW